jgi:hypothetical protein
MDGNMRPISQANAQAASGGETVTYTLPAGSSVTTKLEADFSTTIKVNIPGVPLYTWNSGIAVSCYILATGFAVTAGTLSRNVTVGTLTNHLIAQGCKAVMTNTKMPDPSDDGDS